AQQRQRDGAESGAPPATVKRLHSSLLEWWMHSGGDPTSRSPAGYGREKAVTPGRGRRSHGVNQLGAAPTGPETERTEGRMIMTMKGTLIAASVAGFFASMGGSIAVAADKDTDQVVCSGINACKGTGSCAGPGHACAGQNGCKGQGHSKVSRKECMDK